MFIRTKHGDSLLFRVGFSLSWVFGVFFHGMGISQGHGMLCFCRIEQEGDGSFPARGTGWVVFLIVLVLLGGEFVGFDFLARGRRSGKQRMMSSKTQGSSSLPLGGVVTGKPIGVR